MLDDENPQINQNIIQEEDDDEHMVQNIPQMEIQNDLIDPNANASFQPQINPTVIVENSQEEILKNSSLGNNSINLNNLGQEYLGQNVETIIEKPIVYNGTQTLFTDKPQIANSYSYSNYQNMNDPFSSTQIPQNQANVYKTVYKVNNIPSNNNVYQNVNNNIYEVQQVEQTIPETIINQYPQYSFNYDNYNQISNSTPLVKSPNNISTYQIQDNNINYTLNPNFNNNQDNAKVIRINEELMKDPKTAKYVKESEMHVNNYLSNINNKKNETPIVLKGSEIKYSNNSNINNLKESNNSRMDYIKESKDLNNFSPEFWKNFYNIDDPFFTKSKHDNSIHNKVLKNQENNEVYYGDINDENEMDGLGKLISPDMQRIGEWRKNIFYGWGREVRNDGKIFEGKFVNGELNGKGICKDGAELYIGEFKNYNKHGKGELFTSSYHYVGNFNNNNMDGKGRIEIYDEGVYEGNFNGGSIDGQGVFKYPNGDFYEGEMKKGKMEGNGKLTYANGKVVEGQFSDGKLIGNMYSFRE